VCASDLTGGLFKSKHKLILGLICPLEPAQTVWLLSGRPEELIRLRLKKTTNTFGEQLGGFVN